MNSNSAESCARKTTYFSRKQARAAARGYNLKNGERGKVFRLRAYKCSVCGLFHIGHSAGRFGPCA